MNNRFTETIIYLLRPENSSDGLDMPYTPPQLFQYLKGILWTLASACIALLMASTLC